MEETVLLDVQRIQTSEQSSIILHSVRAVDLVNHLVPELHLLDSHSEPYNVQKTVVNCLYAGQQLARETAGCFAIIARVALFAGWDGDCCREDHREKRGYYP